jgi:hypothetical protein
MMRFTSLLAGGFQFFPELEGPAGMWNDNGTTNQVGDAKDLIQFFLLRPAA